MNMICLIFAAVLSTGVEIPEEGVPTWNGKRQGSVPDVSKIVNVAYSIGLWLDQAAKDVPHGVEILSLCGR